MDAFPDSVTNSSVSSSPHTPSPRTSVSLDELHPPPMTDASSVSSSEYDSKSYIHDPSSSSHHFASLDYIQFTSEPLSEEPASIDNRLDAAPFWPGANPGASPSAPQPQSAPRGSFLSDLYGGSLKLDEVPDPASTPDHVFLASPSAGYLRSNSDWAVAHGASPPTLHLSPPAEQHFYRRASFPFAGHEHDENYPAGPNFMTPDDPAAMNGAFSHRGDCYVFDESLPMSADPSALHAHTGDAHYGSVSPPHQYEREDIKLETSSPVIVPTQGTFYRPSSSSSSLSNGSAPPFMNPHAALPVMHTDDAASKETQYLRRRCFNCHTTEPPSWRRSTLNPGKIVCNKCGLYERTHLRPRPHRFDELRAGNKARKATKSHNPSPHGSPKPLVVKKEPKDYDFDHPMRRGSVASVASGSASGHSDWDDAASVYSSSVGSAPPSTFGSPMAPSFSIPRPPSLSQSPPGSREGPIRIPQAPMAALGRPKAATALYPERPTLPRPIPPSADFYARRGSFDTSISAGRRHTVATGMDEVTGWQSMPMAPPTADKSFARKIAAT